jgi:putative phage-type endonuclease
MSLKPGSAEWLKVISASKVPAILGISPWESPFSLWHRMHGDVGKQEGNVSTERGEFVEEAIISWLRYKLKTVVEYGQQTEHPDHPDWIATPDGQVHVEGAVCGVEAKSQAYDTEWGEEGSAEIPPYYLAQVAWQMIVCGFRRVYVPVLFGLPFEFRLYVVEWSDVEADVPLIIEAVEKFQQSLRDGVPPPIDGATSTYQVIRELHPDIDGETVEVPREVAIAFSHSKQRLDYATEEHQAAKSALADLMGTAQYATDEGVRIARRQAGRNGAAPFVVAVKPPKKKEASA